MGTVSEFDQAVANSLGFETEVTKNNGKRFTKGVRHVWSIYDGWQSADLIDGYFVNHKKFENLQDALNREI